MGLPYKGCKKNSSIYFLSFAFLSFAAFLSLGLGVAGLRQRIHHREWHDRHKKLRQSDDFVVIVENVKNGLFRESL